MVKEPNKEINLFHKLDTISKFPLDKVTYLCYTKDAFKG